MQLDIIPRSFWNLPSRMSNFFDDESDWKSFLPSSGLTISEDDTSVFVETAVPGVDPEKIEVTFDKGILWVRGEAEEVEEDKMKKFYRKASRSFSYRVAVPGVVNEQVEPVVTSKNGILTVVFAKMPESEPKKLKVHT